jgi:hypothetical protein
MGPKPHRPVGWSGAPEPQPAAVLGFGRAAALARGHRPGELSAVRRTALISL